MFIVGLFVGQLFMHDLGQILTDKGWIESTDSSMYGYLIIFFAIAILQMLLYKIITKVGFYCAKVVIFNLDL